ncbi:hypothetical protein ACHAQA_005783 [Verticillium albo-atrum]
MQQALQNLEASTFITNIRNPSAVINYLREGSVRNAMMTAYCTLRDEMGYASNYMFSRRLDWSSIKMPERLDEWFEDFIQAMMANVQNGGMFQKTGGPDMPGSTWRFRWDV